MMVLDPAIEAQLKAEREPWRADRYDEVWDGMYVIVSRPDNEHGDVQVRLATAIQQSLGWDGPQRIQAGGNVSDREDGWLQNYRIPDVVVVFPGSAARDCDTHWCGGPDFCVEIASPGDRSRDKLPFYGGIGVRELLLIDRDPWGLALYRLTNGRLEVVSNSHESAAVPIASDVVPVSFRLVPGAPRPKIEVTHRDGAQHWIV